MDFRDIDLDFLFAALDNCHNRSSGSYYLTHFAAYIGYYAVMVCNKLRIGLFVSVGDQLGLGLTQAGSGRFHLRIILLHHGFADTTAVV